MGQCVQCKSSIGNSPSDDFCTDECQRLWNGNRCLAPLPDISDAKASVNVATNYHANPMMVAMEYIRSRH